GVGGGGGAGREGGSGDGSSSGGGGGAGGVEGSVVGDSVEAKRRALPRGFGAIMELSKPRITQMVVMTAAVGFILAMPSRHSDLMPIVVVAVMCVIGTALSASGANSLNQWWEHHRDAKMPRTALRPIPTGRLNADQALIVGLIFSVLGVGSLVLTCGVAAGGVSLATILVYVLLYTPMKPVTPLSTLVGAVPGALPPLIGWCAARSIPEAVTTSEPIAGGLLEAGGWSLFALMFVWQIPHFLAIAWMYREDYARGGFRMLPIFDKTGHLTSFMVAAWAVLLIPATVAPALVMPERLGLVYVVVAGVSGLVFLAGTVRLMLERTRQRARAVFIGSIIHLPLLLMFMVGEAAVRWITSA
ncbi:MAG: protoheme IX farnesyltransferase, partial [Phycisphaerales bacterium]|nr:protoheme IX farnesyltransferase [Phycisphaerales bacterium]